MGRRERWGKSAQRFLVCETFLWTRYGLLSFDDIASRVLSRIRERVLQEISRICQECFFPAGVMGADADSPRARYSSRGFSRHNSPLRASRAIRGSETSTGKFSSNECMARGMMWIFNIRTIDNDLSRVFANSILTTTIRLVTRDK